MTAKKAKQLCILKKFIHCNKCTLITHCSTVFNYLVDILLYFVITSIEMMIVTFLLAQNIILAGNFSMIRGEQEIVEKCLQSSIRSSYPSMSNQQVRKGFVFQLY